MSSEFSLTGCDLTGSIQEAVGRAQQSFLDQQYGSGYWYAPLEANVTMGAQYIFFNRFLGRETGAEHRILDYLRQSQNSDGSWSLFQDGAGHRSVTAETYAALRMTGTDPKSPEMLRARSFVRDAGGLEQVGALTKIFFAYFGQIPWSAIPTFPVELIFVPPNAGFSIYEMSSWARGTVVPLLVLMAIKPRISAPAGFSVADLYREPAMAGRLMVEREFDKVSFESMFLGLDKALKLWEHLRPRVIREKAIRTTCEWIVEHQDSNGGWGGIQPPMVNSPLALAAAGYPADHPGVANGIQAIDDFLIENPAGNMIAQPCVSPVWDTALAAKALLDSGMAPDHPALVRAAGWLMEKQICKPGDWSIKNPDLEPGGWAFEFENDWYPDVDDSAVILMVLRKIEHPDRSRLEAVIRRGLEWTLGMQCRNGGWASFDTENTLDLLNRIPFADMEAMIDPPTADITGRVLEMMGNYGFDAEDPRAARGIVFLYSIQEKSGAWWGRWGVNYIYGTWSSLAGLRAIGADLNDPRIRRSVGWLKSCQNPDGGWGEDCASYEDPSLAGQGVSTASQTAWAMLGLLAGEDGASPELLRGAEYLVSMQAADGFWDELLFTGTGFPKHFFLRYWMYRAYFPLMALGQLRQRISGD